MTQKINQITCLKNQSKEWIQLSPFFIYSQPFEFQNYSFRTLHLFLEILKIENESDRQELLKKYSTDEALYKLYTIKKGKISYTSEFNTQPISTILFNNEQIQVGSSEYIYLMKNFIRGVAAQNTSLLAAIFANRQSNIQVLEIDSYTKLDYIDSKQYVNFLQTSI